MLVNPKDYILKIQWWSVFKVKSNKYTSPNLSNMPVWNQKMIVAFSDSSAIFSYHNQFMWLWSLYRCDYALCYISFTMVQNLSNRGMCCGSFRPGGKRLNPWCLQYSSIYMQRSISTTPITFTLKLNSWIFYDFDLYSDNINPQNTNVKYISYMIKIIKTNFRGCKVQNIQLGNVTLICSTDHSFVKHFYRNTLAT